MPAHMTPRSRRSRTATGSPRKHGTAGAGVAVPKRTREALAKPQKGSRAREKARRARAKAKHWKTVCELVAARDGHRCRVCLGDHPLWVTPMDFHHIVFRSHGGKDETSNVVLLCRFCHDQVHARRLVISGNADGKLTIERAA